MPRVKIQLADNIKRVVTLDTEATKGATLGTNLLMPSGQIGTPASVLQWLGGALPSQPSGGSGGISLSTILTTKGDLVTRDTQVQRLGIGSAGQALVVAAGLPSWGFVGVPGGGTGLASYQTGDMLFADAPDSLAPLPVGSDGWVLSAYGGFPEWQMPIWVESVIAGTGIAVNDADPQNPVVSLDASVGDLNDVDLSGLTDGDVLVWDNSTSEWVASAPPAGGVENVVPGTGIAVDDTDPANPIVSLDAAVGDLNDVDLSGLADGDMLVWDASTSEWVAAAGGGGAANSAPEVRGASFSSGIGIISVPTNNVPINIREDCTITGAILLTQGGTGSCVLDIWKHPYSTYPPTSADSICSSNKPTISSGVKDTSTLVGWNVTLSAGDTLLVKLVSSSVFTAVSLFLILTPVGSTPADGYTDERVRDVVDAMLTDSSTIDFSYSDIADTLTAAVIANGIDVFTSTLRGAVPASGGGTTNFLRADGSFAVPPGGGTITEGTYNPTLTLPASSNLGSVVKAADFYYVRTGDTVTVHGSVVLDVTAANTQTVFLMSIPVASNFSSSYQSNLSGWVRDLGVSAVQGTNASYIATPTTPILVVCYPNTNHAISGNLGLGFTLTYKVLP